jgi:hypothetical protein
MSRTATVTLEFRDLCSQRPFRMDALRVSYAGNPKLLGSNVRSLKRLSCSNGVPPRSACE